MEQGHEGHVMEMSRGVIVLALQISCATRVPYDGYLRYSHIGWHDSGGCIFRARENLLEFQVTSQYCKAGINHSERRLLY